MVIIDVFVKFKMDGAEKKYITSSSKKMIQELEAIKRTVWFSF